MSETKERTHTRPPGLNNLNKRHLFWALTPWNIHCPREGCETELELLTYTEEYTQVPHIVIFCPGCGEISDHRIILQPVEQYETCATCLYAEFEPGDESVGIWAGYLCVEDHDTSDAWETHDLCPHWRAKYERRR